MVWSCKDDKPCYEDGKCHYAGACTNKYTTNADRVRAMSDEELATWIAGEVLGLQWNKSAFEMAVRGWTKYLQQPAPEEGEQV